MPLPIVRISEVSLFIPGDIERTLVLRNLSLTVNKLQHIGLSGPNGSGKSTLLRLIHGELWPAAGEIAWNGQGDKMETSHIIGHAISTLVSPQKQGWLQNHAWNITARESLGQNLNDKTDKQLLDLLENFLDTPLPKLSQGQMRLLMLCKAIFKKPKLLLLDEWTDGLDSKNLKTALNLLERLASSTTIIIAAHRENAIPEWVEQKLYLDKGRLEKAKGKSITITRKTQEKMFRKAPKQDMAIFTLKKANLYIDRDLILQDINWESKKGEHWQICGENGSGKSTFLRLLAGDEHIAAGGTFTHFSPRAHRILLTLAEKHKSASLVSDLAQACYPYDLKGLELLLSGLDNTIGLYRTFESREIEKARIWLEKAFGSKDAEAIAATSIRKLSSGQQRRLFLIRAMMGEPDVLLLDEPCSGLDPESRNAYLCLLEDLASPGGTGNGPQIIMVSHQEAPHFINRKARMENGRLSILE